MMSLQNQRERRARLKAQSDPRKGGAKDGKTREEATGDL
jgi:hypothetical protein